jgi:hypothetical protein
VESVRAIPKILGTGKKSLTVDENSIRDKLRISVTG